MYPFAYFYLQAVPPPSPSSGSDNPCSVSSYGAAHFEKCWTLTNHPNWYTFNMSMMTIVTLPIGVIVTACYLYVYTVAKRHARAIHQVI